MKHYRVKQPIHAGGKTFSIGDVLTSDQLFELHKDQLTEFDPAKEKAEAEQREKNELAKRQEAKAEREAAAKSDNKVKPS